MTPLYRSGSHTRYDCRYHIVWIPKYRRKVLLGRLKDRLQQLINEKSAELRVIILKGQLEPDHVHLYVSIPPSLSVADYVHDIKGMTSKIIRDEFEEELKVIYWKPVLWAVGYFVATVGEINDEIIRQYIEEQEGRDKDESNIDDGVWG